MFYHKRARAHTIYSIVKTFFLTDIFRTALSYVSIICCVVASCVVLKAETNYISCQKNLEKKEMP